MTYDYWFKFQFVRFAVAFYTNTLIKFKREEIIFDAYLILS